MSEFDDLIPAIEWLKFMGKNNLLDYEDSDKIQQLIENLDDTPHLMPLFF